MITEMFDKDINTPRYVMHSGHIRSENDGDLHFISASRLCQLYGLSHKQRHNVIYYHEKCYKRRPGDIHLHPKNDGDYSLTPKNL